MATATCSGGTLQVLNLDPVVAGWPHPARAAIAVTTPTTVLGQRGDTSQVGNVASISKLFVAMACLVAVEEGTLDLDEPAGRPGATVRHLLAHAAGYDFDQPRFVARVGVRRIYSNVGIEIVAEHLAHRAEMPFGSYLDEAVLEPLGLDSTELRGSPAHGVRSSVDDLMVFARELLRPTLIHPTTMAEATWTQFPRLSGVLPGWGRFDPLPWGLGFEIRGDRQMHWSGSRTSPATFGHFGGSGAYLFVDPDLGVGVAAMSGAPFHGWARTAWPVTNDAVVELIVQSSTAPGR